MNILRSLPLKLGGFGYPSYTTLVTHIYPLAKEQCMYFLGSLGLGQRPQNKPPDQATVLKPLDIANATAIRNSLPENLRSLFDDHQNPSASAFLTALPVSANTILSDTEFRIGCWSRSFRSGFTGSCNCNALANTPSHDLSCHLAQVTRTKKHYAINHLFGRAFELSGAHVEWEPPGANLRQDERFTDLDDSPPRPQRGDLSSRGGATLGAAKAVFDISIATCSHTTRVESINNALETRHQIKLNTYRSVFGNFYPIVVSPKGTYHHSVTAIFQALKSHGVDFPALKTDIAFTLPKTRC